MGIVDDEGHRIWAERDTYRVIEGEPVRSIFYHAKSGRFVFEAGPRASPELWDAVTFSGPLRRIGKSNNIGDRTDERFFGVRVGSTFAIFDGEVGALVALPPEVRDPTLVTARGDALVLQGNPAGSPCASRAKAETAWALHAKCESRFESDAVEKVFDGKNCLFALDRDGSRRACFSSLPSVVTPAKYEPDFRTFTTGIVHAGRGVLVGQAFLDGKIRRYALRKEGPPVELPSIGEVRACQADGVAPIFTCVTLNDAIAFVRAEPTRVMKELEIAAQKNPIDERRYPPHVLSTPDGAFAVAASCDGKDDGRYCVRQPSGEWRSLTIPKEWKAGLDAKGATDVPAPGSPRFLLLPRIDGSLAMLRVDEVARAEGSYRFRLLLHGSEPRETEVRGVPLGTIAFLPLLLSSPIQLLRWLRRTPSRTE